MKTIQNSAVSAKVATVSINHSLVSSHVVATHADATTSKPDAKASQATSLLPGVAIDAPHHKGSDAVSGRQHGGDKPDSDVKSSNDGATGHHFGKDMISEYDGKSYVGSYESWPNGDGFRNENSDGTTDYYDKNGPISTYTDDGMSVDNDLPEEDGYNGQSIGEPDNEPKEPKDEPKGKPKPAPAPETPPPAAPAAKDPADAAPEDDESEDDESEDDGSEDDESEDGSEDDETDNTPPEDCQPGTVPELDGGEEHREKPDTVDPDRVRAVVGKNGGDVDPVDGDGTGWTGDIKTDLKIENVKDSLLGGGLHHDNVQVGQGVGGLNGPDFSSPQNGGAIDFGDEHTDTQGSPREEPGSQPVIDPRGRSGQQNDASDQDTAEATEAGAKDARPTLRDAVVTSPIADHVVNLFHAPDHLEFAQTERANVELDPQVSFAAQRGLDRAGFDMQHDEDAVVDYPVTVEPHAMIAHHVLELDFA